MEIRGPDEKSKDMKRVVVHSDDRAETVMENARGGGAIKATRDPDSGEVLKEFVYLVFPGGTEGKWSLPIDQSMFDILMYQEPS